MSQKPSSRPDSSFRMVLFGACAVVFVVLLLAGYDGSRDLARLKARETILEGRLSRTEAGIERLRDRIVRLQEDPHMLEKVAREELGLSRPDEIIVILPSAPAASGAATTPVTP